jgi:hypothetical protein
MVKVRRNAPIDVEVDRIPKSTPGKAVVCFRALIMKRYYEIDVILGNSPAGAVKHKPKRIHFDKFDTEDFGGSPNSLYTFVFSSRLIGPKSNNTNLFREPLQVIKFMFFSQRPKSTRELAFR